MKSKFFLIFIVLLSIGCKNNRDYINIHNRDFISIMNIVDSISIVPLETTDNCLINVISKVIPYKDRYYIFDSREHRILCFDNTGKYLFKYDKKGNGHDEYTYLDDFAIDRINEQIILLVPFGFVLYLDMECKFIAKTKLPSECLAYHGVNVLNQDTLVFHSLSHDYMVLYYSKSENKIISKYYPQDDLAFYYSDERLWNYNGQLYYNPNFSNGVDVLSANGHEEVFAWDFGSDNNKDSQINELKTDLKKGRVTLEDMVVNKGRYVDYLLLSNYETDRYRITILGKEEQDKLNYLKLFFDKKENKSIVFSETVEGIRPYPVSYYDNLMIMFNVEEKYHNYLKPFTEEVLSERSRKIVQSHRQDEDNPLLVLHHLKI